MTPTAPVSCHKFHRKIIDKERRAAQPPFASFQEKHTRDTLSLFFSRPFGLPGHLSLPKYLYSGKATRTTFTSFDVTQERREIYHRPSCCFDVARFVISLLAVSCKYSCMAQRRVRSSDLVDRATAHMLRMCRSNRKVRVRRFQHQPLTRSARLSAPPDQSPCRLIGGCM